MKLRPWTLSVGEHRRQVWSEEVDQVRLGDDPLSSPVFTPKELHELMEREGLAEDFFSGRPIEAGPTAVTTAQRDALIESPALQRSAQAKGN